MTSLPSAIQRRSPHRADPDREVAQAALNPARRPIRGVPVRWKYAAATYLRHGGVDMKEIQETLGYATLAMTSDTYTSSSSNSVAAPQTPAPTSSPEPRRPN
jgi:hypothetical protein